MESDWVSIVSLVVAVVALLYSIFSNTKRYELTYQYYTDILTWHNQVVEILVNLRINPGDVACKQANLARLSALIENGRFYFPNVDRKDGFGVKKPVAYQGYRNIVLDFLVYEYQIFERDDSMNYVGHAEVFQRLFTSHVFQYLDPKRHNKKIKHNTHIPMKKEITINEFLQKSPDMLYAFYSIDRNADNWTTRPTERKRK